MSLRKFNFSALAISLILAAGLAQAADQTKDKVKDQTKDQTRDRTQLQEQIYGSQMMTEQERLEHRSKMLTLKTEQERAAYRLEHHKRMQERAKERGITLPDEPMMRPGGMGPGGMGPGGMGPGGGRR